MSMMLAQRLAELGIDPQTLAARGLRLHAEPAALVEADRGADGRVFELIAPAAVAWQQLRDAAAADGISLFLVSAFRSIARQHEIVAAKLARGQRLEEILRVSAAPGYSEHHTGRAIDIGTPGSPLLEQEFETTAAYAWLTAHAGRFGFTLSYPAGNADGYLYEPWHWCWQTPDPRTPKEQQV
ncbi:M15 family metallopeptidase [Vogesella oryzae]|uniref:M15 family metallopeptidase n=1 Tax=Vogesella oryzae TaxID=1735285 RepID=UPI001583C10B|nr:M15 family metallopeptidase [Vogesella oryzae]